MAGQPSRRDGPAGFDNAAFKVCDLCGALNHAAQPVCFVCGWHGHFATDPDIVHEAAVRFGAVHEPVPALPVLEAPAILPPPCSPGIFARFRCFLCRFWKSRSD